MLDDLTTLILADTANSNGENDAYLASAPACYFFPL